MAQSSTKCLWLAALLCALIVHPSVAQKNFPVNFNGTLDKDVALVSVSAFAVNLQDVLEVHVTRSPPASVQLCLQRLVTAPVPAAFASCTHLVTLAANESTTTLSDVSGDPYSWSLVLAPGSSRSMSGVSVQLTLQGSFCAERQVWNGAACVTPHEMAALNATLALSLSSGASEYAMVSVPDRIGALRVSVGDARVTVTVRVQGSPSDTRYTAQAPGALNLSLPRPGLWFIRLAQSVVDTLNANVSLSVDDCRLSLRQGPGCALNVSVASAQSVAHLTMAPLSVHYFELNTTALHQLWVSVFAPDAKTQPTMAITRGNLPAPEDADVRGCNRASCSVPSIVVSNASLSASEPLWFVSVTVPNATVSLGVWFSSLCAPGCDTHGTCDTDGVDGALGQCKCVSDYEGVDCMTPAGPMLGTQYIVLIVIASLVVASALIGFASWAYMRRRRQQYQVVG